MLANTFFSHTITEPIHPYATLTSKCPVTTTCVPCSSIQNVTMMFSWLPSFSWTRESPPPYSILDPNSNPRIDFVDPAACTTLKIDFVELAHTTRAVSARFDSIHSQIRSFDGISGYSYASTWDGFKGTWHRALADSSNLAVTMANSAEEFKNDITPPVLAVLDSTTPSPVWSYLGALPKDDAQKKLDKGVYVLSQYIIKAEGISKKAKAVADSLLGLQASIQSFSQTIQYTASSIIAQHRGTISCLYDQIRTIQGDLERIMRERSIFSSNEPITYRLREIDGTNSRIRDASAFIEQIQTQQPHPNIDQLPAVVEGMVFLEKIWNTIKSDCESLRKYLQDARRTGTPTASVLGVLTVYLKNTNTVYANLGSSLKGYASLVPPK